MSSWKHYIAVLLVVLIIGGITFVTEFLPKRTTDKGDDVPEGEQSALNFTRTRVQWDADGYIKEYEPYREGHYDFPFFNKGSNPHELGMIKNGCDCTRVLVAPLTTEQWAELKPDQVKATVSNVIPPEMKVQWHEMVVDRDKALLVPPDTGGVVRLIWHGRKNPGSDLNLSASLWSRTKGSVPTRTTDLQVPLVMSFPLNFMKMRQEKGEKEDIGVLGPRKVVKTEFQLWSPTRDEIELKVKTDHLPKNVQATIEPMSRADAKALEEDLRKKQVNTRVLWAGRLLITIHETKDNASLDIGPFAFSFPLQMEDNPLELPIPQIRGRVEGDVEIGAGKDAGKINLAVFSAKTGTKKEVPIWVPNNVKVQFVRIEHGSDKMAAEVTKTPEDSTDGKTRWNVKISVPPDTHLGEYAPEAALVLSLQTTPPRQLRIPIVGTASTR